MKEIKQCPLKKEKCSYRINRTKSITGCSIYNDVNLCDKCTRYRKKQRKQAIRYIKIQQIQAPWCKW